MEKEQPIGLVGYAGVDGSISALSVIKYLCLTGEEINNVSSDD